MFTGLIREIAEVKSFQDTKLAIKSGYRPQIGDSIAINGACLTVTELLDDGFAVELSHESRGILALERYEKKVHMEPAMQFGSRIEGHMVQGHIDCVGVIKKIVAKSQAYDFYIQIPQEQMKLVIPKGSIAVDGVSLTINDIEEDSFRLTIIPHTIKNTLFSSYKTDTRVNIETDMFARYIYHMFAKKDESKIKWDTVDKIMALY